MKKNINIEALGLLGFCLLVMALAGAVLLELRGARPPIYDPLGTAFFPRIISYVIIALAIFIAVTAARHLFRVDEMRDEPAVTLSTYRKISVMLLSLALYIFAIHIRLTPFSILTAIFLFVTISDLENWRRKSLLPVAITSVVLGVAMEVTFTRLFVMDLPRF